MKFHIAYHTHTIYKPSLNLILILALTYNVSITWSSHDCYISMVTSPQAPAPAVTSTSYLVTLTTPRKAAPRRSRPSSRLWWPGWRKKGLWQTRCLQESRSSWLVFVLGCSLFFIASVCTCSQVVIWYWINLWLDLFSRAYIGKLFTQLKSDFCAQTRHTCFMHMYSFRFRLWLKTMGIT